MESGTALRMDAKLPPTRYPMGIPRRKLPRLRASRMPSHDAQTFMRPLLETLPLIRAVDSVFQEYLPERYAAQAGAASRIGKSFLIDCLPFTTVTINRNWQTAVHLDEGDF